MQLPTQKFDGQGLSSIMNAQPVTTSDTKSVGVTKHGSFSKNEGNSSFSRPGQATSAQKKKRPWFKTGKKNAPFGNGKRQEG